MATSVKGNKVLDYLNNDKSFTSKSNLFQQKNQQKHSQLEKILQLQENYLNIQKQKIDPEILQQTQDIINQKNQKYITRIINGNFDQIGNSSLVERNLLQKRIKERNKNKELLEKQIKNAEYEMENLKSQGIKHYKQAESNSYMKMQLLEENQQRNQQAKELVLKLKKEQYELQKQKLQREIELQKKKEEEQESQKQKEEQEKQQKRQEREKAYKEKREKITAEMKELKERQEKIDIQKKPLFKKYEQNAKERQEKQEQEIQEQLKKKHEQFMELNKNYKAAESQDQIKQYEENFKKKLEEKKLQREQQQKEFQEKYKAAQVHYKHKNLDSILQSDKEQLIQQNNRLQLENQKAEKRKKYIKSLKQNQNIKVNEDLALEIKIQKDKMENPWKYIKKSKNQTDQQIFLNSENQVRKIDATKSKEEGLKYLKQLKEMNQNMDLKSVKSHRYLENQSEKLTLPKINSNNSAQHNTESLLPKLKQNNQPPKNYMDDVRKKYSLDSKVNNWRRFLKGSDENEDLLNKKYSEVSKSDQNGLFNTPKAGFERHIPLSKNAISSENNSFMLANQLNNKHISSSNLYSNRQKKGLGKGQPSKSVNAINYYQSLNNMKHKNQIMQIKETNKQIQHSNIFQESEKLLSMAQKKEQLARINMRPGNLKDDDIRNMNDVAEIYMDSIKAKLALLDQMNGGGSGKPKNISNNNNPISPVRKTSTKMNQPQSNNSSQIYNEDKFDNDEIDNELDNIDQELAQLQKQKQPQYVDDQQNDSNNDNEYGDNFPYNYNQQVRN